VSDNQSDSDRPPGGQRDRDADPAAWGPLRIVERLGSGTSSAIYRARDTVLERDISLQVFRTGDPDERQQLLEQGRALARIRHPNIVQVSGADEHDGMVGLKMELVEGQSLGNLLEEQGLLDAREASLVGRQLCAALGALHEAGVPYRPVSLHNVIREPGGGVRLMGLCSDTDQADLAPEIQAGETPGPSAEIYALGALLLRMTTGSFPAPDDTGDLPEPWLACLNTATADDPAHRYETPARFAKGLTQAVRRPSSPIRRIIGIAIILTLAVLVILQWPSQYRVNSDWYLLGAEGSPIAFASGDALAVGDCLALDVSPTIPMFVYVFSEDSSGIARGLYPRADANEENPLSPDEKHALAVTSTGSRCWRIGNPELQRIHVLASPERIPEFRQLYFSVSQGEPEGVAVLPLIEAARKLDQKADIAIGVTYKVLELQVTESDT
jgi:hypothetical protein